MGQLRSLRRKQSDHPPHSYPLHPSALPTPNNKKESQMLAIRIGVTIAQISFCGQNIECTSPQRHTHWKRKEEDYELI